MTTFVWPYEGAEVAVAGSFNNWEKVPLTRGPKGFHATIELATGTYEYKFVVDGRRWCYDILKPNQFNDAGHRNNVITIEKGGKKAAAPAKEAETKPAPQKAAAPQKSPAPQKEAEVKPAAQEAEAEPKGKGKGKGQQQQQQQQKKGGDKKEKGGASALANAQAKKVAGFVKSNAVPFSIYDVECADSIADTVDTAKILQPLVPDFGVLLFSGDKERLVVAGFVPKEKVSTVTALELVNEALSVVPGNSAEGNETFAQGVIEANPDKGIFPMKLRDQGRTPVFALLRKKSLMPEESSEDEMYFF